MIATLLLRVSVVLGLAGMALGIGMGIRQDFLLVPAHAHLNLLGFVGLFLSGLYYHAVPQAAACRLAKVHAGLSILGAVVFPLGIAAVLVGGHDRFMAFPIAGALIAFAAMGLFAVIVVRNGAAR